MKISEDNKIEIRDRFKKMNNLDEFISLLNYSYEVLQNGDKKMDFQRSKVNYFAFHHPKKYSSFEIKKSNGKARLISTPKPYLKSIQRCLNLQFQLLFTSHHCAHGFVENRSIVSNARVHTGKRYVLNVDLKDFFNSINFRRVKTVLGLSPLSLQNEKEELAFLIANICTWNGALPQGAPTSPIITNIVCQRLDRKLSRFAKENNSRYSRYADDITFSSNKNDFRNSQFFDHLVSIINDEGFELNHEKTRVQDWKGKQEVTGLVINEKVNVSRHYIRGIRAALNNYEHKGFDYAQKQFEKHWTKAKAPPSFKKSLSGKIEFIGMVRGRNDQIYRKYKEEYIRLFGTGTIDYGFVKNEELKFQLTIDLKNMEAEKRNPDLREEDKFKQYCIHAFYQIEQLIDYYFSHSLTFDELCKELRKHTKAKSIHLDNRTHVSEIPVLFKFYLFEKIFYYDRRVGFYESIITSIRIIRNWRIHRNLLSAKYRSEILNKHEEIQLRKKEYWKKTRRSLQLSKKESHVTNEYKAINILENKDFKVVLETIKNVAEIVKTELY